MYLFIYLFIHIRLWFRYESSNGLSSDCDYSFEPLDGDREKKNRCCLATERSQEQLKAGGGGWKEGRKGGKSRVEEQRKRKKTEGIKELEIKRK